MRLQKFVTEVIESLGGVVEPMEYALCEVLIPEEYKSYFQNKTELELSFDYEVAQENPQSEFVTFGSFIFEQVLTIANQKAISTLRFAEVERQTLANPLKKIREFLHDENGEINILSASNVMGVWAVFQFHIAFISDEKEESSEQVWVNLITGEIAENLKKKQNSIMYVSQALYNYPVPTDLNMDEAYVTAFNHVKNNAESEQRKRLDDHQLEKDIDRIKVYYEELKKENDKRAGRKGISDEKVEEIAAKSNAITIEMDKQIEEIKKKYNGHTEITIDHGILYFIPVLQYTIEIVFRGERKQQTLYYNPITKDFDIVTSKNATVTT